MCCIEDTKNEETVRLPGYRTIYLSFFFFFLRGKHISTDQIMITIRKSYYILIKKLWQTYSTYFKAETGDSGDWDQQPQTRQFTGRWREPAVVTCFSHSFLSQGWNNPRFLDIRTKTFGKLARLCTCRWICLDSSPQSTFCDKHSVFPNIDCGLLPADRAQRWL